MRKRRKKTMMIFIMLLSVFTMMATVSAEKKPTLLGTSNRYYYTIRQKIRSIVINCHYIIFRRAKKSQKLKAAMKKLQPYIVVSTEKKKQ